MAETTRRIEFSSPGSGHGPIRAMVPTAELRERLKPFVFLDHFDVATDDRWGFAFHPHSGVATFTYAQTADLHHEDTGGNRGVVSEGSVQWMAAGRGIWHQEYYVPRAAKVSGLQLWVVLPPDHENAEVAYQVAERSELPVVGKTRVLAGEFEGARSPVLTPYPFNYFDIELSAGERWSFTPPADHNVAWVYNYSGSVAVAGEAIASNHLMVLQESAGSIDVDAPDSGAAFVVGTAKRSPWSIVASRGSMHTNENALRAGVRRIAELGQELQSRGQV